MVDAYHPGWILPPDKVFIVETVIDGKFVFLGKVLVTGQEVAAEMDAAHSIKGHMHQQIAQKLAERKYADADPIVVTPEKI